MTPSALEALVVGWNRSALDLRSDEVLAQVLDRGNLAAWRELYALAARDAELRQRILATVRGVALPFPRFWQAAMAALGEDVDWEAALPEDPGIA
jgi:hypothetical protein